MKKTKRGYIIVYSPSHPFKNSNGWVLQHRLVMEDMLGRYLRKEEVVHHIDSNKTNNNIKNLKLFPNHSEHVKYHINHGWREMISKNSTGRKHTPEAKEKCRIAKLENKHCVGRKYSEETILKMRESQKKRRELERYATAY